MATFARIPVTTMFSLQRSVAEHFGGVGGAAGGKGGGGGGEGALGGGSGGGGGGVSASVKELDTDKCIPQVRACMCGPGQVNSITHKY